MAATGRSSPARGDRRRPGARHPTRDERRRDGVSGTEQRPDEEIAPSDSCVADPLVLALAQPAGSDGTERATMGSCRAQLRERVAERRGQTGFRSTLLTIPVGPLAIGALAIGLAGGRALAIGLA